MNIVSINVKLERAIERLLVSYPLDMLRRAAKELDMTELQSQPDPTEETCKLCGATVHSPCTTETQKIGCELPDFCFPNSPPGALSSQNTAESGPAETPDCPGGEPMPGAGIKPDRRSCHDHPMRRCTPGDCCQTNRTRGIIDGD